MNLGRSPSRSLVVPENDFVAHCELDRTRVLRRSPQRGDDGRPILAVHVPRATGAVEDDALRHSPSPSSRMTSHQRRGGAGAFARIRSSRIDLTSSSAIVPNASRAAAADPRRRGMATRDGPRRPACPAVASARTGSRRRTAAPRSPVRSSFDRDAVGQPSDFPGTRPVGAWTAMYPPMVCSSPFEGSGGRKRPPIGHRSTTDQGLFARGTAVIATGGCDARRITGARRSRLTSDRPRPRRRCRHRFPARGGTSRARPAVARPARCRCRPRVSPGVPLPTVQPGAPAGGLRTAGARSPSSRRRIAARRRRAIPRQPRHLEAVKPGEGERVVSVAAMAYPHGAGRVSVGVKRSKICIVADLNRPVRRAPNGMPASYRVESPRRSTSSYETSASLGAWAIVDRTGTGGSTEAPRRSASSDRFARLIIASRRSATSERSSFVNAYVDRTRFSNGSCEYASLRIETRPRSA